MKSALEQLAAKASLRTGLDGEQKPARLPLGHAGADFCLGGGLRRGTVHEVFAADGHAGAATGFAAVLAARIGEKRKLLWARQDFSALEQGELSATGFLELGIDPDRFILLRVADAIGVLRAAATALACPALGAVVAEIPSHPKILDLAASRRLTLAAAGKGVTAIVLRPNAVPSASSAETRWNIRAAPSMDKNDWGAPIFDAELIRNRHGLTGHWVMEWSMDNGIFREPGTAAHSGALVAAPFHRPAATAPKRIRV